MTPKRKTSAPQEHEESAPAERQPKKRGHDPDSEPPRTAEPPESTESEEENWDRQEGC